MKKRQIFGLALGIILCVFSNNQAQEKYPSHPIDLVVPFAPGGHADVIARSYTQELSNVLRIPITVVNRGGASGILGTNDVINSKKDGYTLLGTASTPVIIMPIISSEVTYNPLKDLIPLGQIGNISSFFAVRSDSPFKTLDELLEYARKIPVN